MTLSSNSCAGHYSALLSQDGMSLEILRMLKRRGGVLLFINQTIEPKLKGGGEQFESNQKLKGNGYFLTQHNNLFNVALR